MAHAIYYPEKISAHRTPNGHPENFMRLKAIQEGLSNPNFDFLEKKIAPVADVSAAASLHTQDYIDVLSQPFDDEEPIRSLDEMDTYLDYDSLAAALAGVGAGREVVDRLSKGELKHGFVATRPPGHHALSHKAMGFCLLGTAALTATYAQEVYGHRVAVLDFDLHHGNGTQALLFDKDNTFFASTQERNIWPQTSQTGTTGVYNHIHNIDLKRGSGTRDMEAAWTELFERMDAFSPDLVVVSAGFDAHQHDPLSGLRWQNHSYEWIAKAIGERVQSYAKGGVVSILEGGYEQSVLRKSVPLYIKTMADVLSNPQDT